MADLAPQMPRLSLSWYRAAGHDPDALFAAPGLVEADLLGPEGCSWDAFCELLDRMAVVVPLPRLTEGLADAYVAMPGYPTMRAMMRNAASVQTVFRLFMVLGPRATPCIRGHVVRETDRQLEVEIGLLDPDARPSPIYFEVTAAAFRLVPERMLGLEGTRVDWTSDGRTGHFTVTPPPHRTLWTRMRAAWSILRGRDANIAGLEESYAEALAQHDALEEARVNLDRQVEERTAELAALNATLVSSSKAKSRHLAEVSHELRTPLNAIIGYAELLAEEARDEGHDTMLPDLQRVETAARHLLVLVSDVLDLSKIEAGRMQIASTGVALDEVVLEVADALRPVVEQHGNALVVEVEPSDPVRGDAHRVRQILTNLIGNAAKFTQGGTVTIAARANTVEVGDTGVGMTPHTIERVFSPWEQAEPTGSGVEGTGLGLTISRQLASLMGGEIHVWSTPGQGSRFTLVLPFWTEAAT